jgi:magnesium-transporting ATPase (P-type)
VNSDFAYSRQGHDHDGQGLPGSTRNALKRLDNQVLPAVRSRLETYHRRGRARRESVHLRQGSSSFRPFVSILTVGQGAPNAILKLAELQGEQARAFRDKAQEFAHRGFRSLGVAVQEQGGKWQVLGMLPMFDPPRSDTAQTIEEALALGVRIKMLTGDAVAIAKVRIVPCTQMRC